MHCFRTVIDTGNGCIPLSRKYLTLAEAVRHYDHLYDGMSEALPKCCELLISEYDDEDGKEVVVRDFSAEEIDLIPRENVVDGSEILAELLARVDERCGGIMKGDTPLTNACDAARRFLGKAAQ